MLQHVFYRLCLLYVLIAIALLANDTADSTSSSMVTWCQDQVQSILTEKKWEKVNID